MTHVHRLTLLAVLGFAACGDDGGHVVDGPPGPDGPDGGPRVGPEISEPEVVETAVAGFTGARALAPDISFSGTQYLVVWRDRRLGYSNDVWGARVNPDGTLADPRGFPITTTVADEGFPTVARLANQWIVAWTVDDDGVAAALVSDTAGVTPLGTVAGTAAVETNVDIASNGTTALLVGQADNDIRGAIYSTALGTPFDIAATAAAEANPGVAPSAGDYLVAWGEGDTAQDLRGQLVTPTG